MDLEQPDGPPPLPASPPAINVLATSEQGTLAALKEAAVLARSEHLPVVVLVPYVVQYGTAMNGVREGENIIGMNEDLASRVGLNISVRICPCREPRHLVSRLMMNHARIVLGGRRGWWRDSAEQRLARELACDGHQVTFVDVDTGKSQQEWSGAA